MTTPPDAARREERFTLEPLVGQTLWLDEVGSTNQFLANEVAGSEAAVVATWNQRAGKGRMGRDWVSPAGGSLALSLRIWPELAPNPLEAQWMGALSLLAGEQLALAVSRELGRDVDLKWPNDVEVEGKKLAGILGEVTPSGHVIVGVGINVWLRADELPAPRATSLQVLGAMSAEVQKSLFGRWLAGLRRELQRCDPGLSVEQRDRISSRLCTLGEQVRVEFAGGECRMGVARGIDSAGRLLVEFADTQSVEAVAAGDVWHLRRDTQP